MPTRTHASKGSAAASPHTHTSVPVSRHTFAVWAMRRSTDGCHGSVYSARWGDILSAAITYCVRSFVPIDTKSTSGANLSIMMATEGTSTMMPAFRPRSWTRPANHWVSATVEIIGAITRTCSCPTEEAANLIASSWRGRNSWLWPVVRIPRTPRAGFASSSSGANGTGLSEPESNVRTTTFDSGNSCITFPYSTA